jgi:nucleotide-binding universal stress UspA family protein
MGAHGRGAFMDMLLGSVANKVVRLSPVPVLTVRLPKENAAG